MWHVWRTELPGRYRVDIRDPDYLNAWFVFYDENANPVRVHIRDSFDVEKLRYTYEKVDLPWMHKKPLPRRRITKTPLTGSLTEPTTFPKALDSVIKTRVIRPGKKRSKQEKEEQEEVLVVEFEIKLTDEFVKFDVYVNDMSNDEDDENNVKVVRPELAGSYTSLVHKGKHMVGKDGKMVMVRKSSLKLGLNTLLEELGDEDNEIVEVSLVPRTGTQGIEITDVKIVYVSD
ncbi:hypothetical protein RND81_02G212000 [Saponaria officinalis]|uniref:Polyphenol oxidase C-terminal domain-containing protein n=1 Tax=Saponaria officinalis TaxID=3572 RepID=A0AAW1MP98_SAPOF